MRDHVSRRPIPIEQSILWKPLHDSHYVVASLQFADGGRRAIFVRQQTLRRVEALVRAHGRRTVGLLLGQLYQCAVTGADYLVIESIEERTAVGDEAEIAATVAEAVADRATEHHSRFLKPIEHRPHVIGWYRGVPTVEAKPSPSTAGVHISLFDQPWQVTLVVGESAHGGGGAFFLRDSVNSRWFIAPFSELLAHAPTPNQPKPTLVDWPQYLTADIVVPGAREATSAVELADVRLRTSSERPEEERSRSKENGARPGESASVADVPLVASLSASASVRPTPAPTPTFESIEPALADAPPTTSRRSARPLSKGTPDVLKTDRERPISRWADRSGEKLSIVDDRDQRTEGPSTGRSVSDADDTTAGDDPARYIELARSEGFFIAAKFHSMAESSLAETLWTLNEPFSGMLLVVVTTESEVVDGTLHYNLQTDDAGLHRTPFPEHRDPESKTIYVRETCVESLRDRCRRLRATNALVREWRVTPTISFLTSAEWESILVADAGTNRGAAEVTDLNNARIAELPAGVRSQFHIRGAGEASA